MRARTCINCKSYMIIHPDSLTNQKKLNRFEALHANHALVSVDYFELKDDYKRFNVSNSIFVRKDKEKPLKIKHKY